MGGTNVLIQHNLIVNSKPLESETIGWQMINMYLCINDKCMSILQPPPQSKGRDSWIYGHIVYKYGHRSVLHSTARQ